jgi:hypothetical protein
MPAARSLFRAAMVLLWLMAPVTAVRAQEGFMGGFLVAMPLHDSTDAAVRALLPEEGAFNYVTAEGAFVAGPVRLTWRPQADAYAFFYFPEENPDDVLYRAAMLGEREVLWQSVEPIGAGEAVFYEVFVTYHFDDMVLPLYLAVEALAPLMAAHDVALLPAPDTLGMANPSGLWLLEGRAEDILAVLRQAAVSEDGTSFDMILLPVQE